MKRKMMEEQERGWSSLGDKYVCADCFNDDALARFVKENASSHECDYCGRTSKRRPIAAPIDDVVEYIDAGLRSEWGDPNNELPYDSREGGYQGTVLDAWDLFQDELGDCFANDKLLEEITEAYDAQGTQFCQRDYFALTPSDALLFGWQEFCGVIKHKTRFLFLAERDEDSYVRSHDEITPSTFLDNLGKVITETGLVRVVQSGTRFYRVRVHKPSEYVKTAKDLGTPPEEHARFSNRMSPAGIPLFYGASDRLTTVKETYDPQQVGPVLITGGEFLTARPLLVCDFTHLPPIPSLFETEKRHTRHDLVFLHDFVADLSKPIERDGREHIEYVPTQVVTEFLRRVYSHPDLGPVHGILYRSAKRSSGLCCALFFESEDCTDLSPGWEKEHDGGRYKWWLGLDPASVVSRKPPKKR
jgi:hypothetical protein